MNILLVFFQLHVCYSHSFVQVTCLKIKAFSRGDIVTVVRKLPYHCQGKDLDFYTHTQTDPQVLAHPERGVENKTKG